MYYYPFLLLSDDDIRNSTMADLIEGEMHDDKKLKEEFYRVLPDDLPKKVLYDLLDIQNTITLILLDTFRCNLNILSTNLGEAKIWQVKEKLKRLLAMLRRKCSEIMYPIEELTFFDIVSKTEKWEESKIFAEISPAEWNSLFLTRLSDIHRYVSKLVEVLEPQVLVKNHLLKSPSVDTNRNIEITTVGHVLETCRLMYKEVKEYILLIDSL